MFLFDQAFIAVPCPRCGYERIPARYVRHKAAARSAIDRHAQWLGRS